MNEKSMEMCSDIFKPESHNFKELIQGAYIKTNPLYADLLQVIDK